MRKKLFGKNIIPNCAYCENAIFDGMFPRCSKGKQLQENKCWSFKYDPLLRVPKSNALKGNYTAEDFKL
ncbi:MAG: hypothetical protein MJ089_08490 [Ruminococcus sp.]|nr:hypothetical protein [Ruminococcus sp.]